MLFITAPSKTQEPTDKKLENHTTPWFLDRAAELITALTELNPTALSSLMNLSDKLGDSTYDV